SRSFDNRVSFRGRLFRFTRRWAASQSSHRPEKDQSLGKTPLPWDAPAVTSALRQRLGAPARSFGRVFRNPNIRRIEGAWAASIIAHWAYGIALAVFAYRQGGAAAVGIVGLVRFLPSAIASPFAAMLGDRFPRERVIVVAELTRSLLLAASVFVIALEGPVARVYVLAGLLSTALS